MDAARVVRVSHDRALDIDAFGFGIHKEQGDALQIARLTSAACRHDQQVGDMALQHEGFAAIQDEPVGRWRSTQGNVGRSVFGVFVHRQCGNGRSTGQLGEP